MYITTKPINHNYNASHTRENNEDTEGNSKMKTLGKNGTAHYAPEDFKM